MKSLRGVAPPITTPFQKGGPVDEASLRMNLEKWKRTGLSGFAVLGSNGEGVHLTLEEKRRVVEIAREAIPEDLWMVVGTGEPTTQATISLTKDAADRGANAALVAPPFYYKGSMKHHVLSKHYQEVAEASPIPVLVYNVPQFTGLNLEPQLISELANHPNIHGIKDSSGNIAQLTEIRRSTPADFAVFVGSAPVFLAALAIGADGGILAAANCLPEAFVRLFNLVDEGALQEARELQWSLMEISRAVTSEYGIGGLKAAMDLMGYRGGKPRAPVPIPNDDDKDRLKRLLAPFMSS